MPKLRRDEFLTTYAEFDKVAKEDDQRRMDQQIAMIQAQTALTRSEAEKAAAMAEEAKKASDHKSAEHLQRVEETQHRAAETKASADAAIASEAEQIATLRDQFEYKYRCKHVVPESAKVLYEKAEEDAVLIRLVVMKKGADSIRTVCRDRRFIIRPFKLDDEERKESNPLAQLTMPQLIARRRDLLVCQSFLSADSSHSPFSFVLGSLV